MAFAAALGLSEGQVGIAYALLVTIAVLLLLCCGGLYFCYARDRLRRQRGGNRGTKRAGRPISRPIMTQLAGGGAFRQFDGADATSCASVF